MTSPSHTMPALAGQPCFHYRAGVLHAEDVSLASLAERFGTPLYVYSRAALALAWESYRSAAGDRPVLVCYGMKANSNLAVLKEFARLGAGFDIVSGGELARVLAVGGDPAKIVFSGVGKQAWEMRAALEAGVKSFNVESEAELRLLSEVAVAMATRAPVSIRVNPDVDAQTHPYISTGLKENKFGIAIETARDVYRLAAKLPNLDVKGVDCHIGSQLTDVSPYLDALEKLLDLIDALALDGIRIEHLDIGGGLGIRYSDETPLPPAALLDRVFARLAARHLSHLQLVMEPGRSLVGNAGVLLTTVQYLKHAEARNFAIVDAAMNDLLRPALYQAWHGVVPVRLAASVAAIDYDVVGPVCESADWLAKQRPLAIEQGDVLALESAGAYAMVMASNYNSRPRAAEIMVDGSAFHVVRQRETLDDLLRGESVLPD
jgi:diaminopimelate decarboxylase